MPERLRRFNAADWKAGVPKSPPAHIPDGEVALWRGVVARRLWADARRAWCEEHGTTVLQILRAEMAATRARTK